MRAERSSVRFSSGRTECAAWHYPGANGACLIMAGGFAVPKEPGTDRFARRFQEAGYSVLAFDYRGLGASGGTPRQVLPVRRQLADWHAAVGFAAGLPEVDPDRIALWGFSASAGFLLPVAARDRRVAAVVAQSPAVGGLAASRLPSGHQSPSATLRLTARGIADAVGGLLGRPPLMVPLAGPRGTLAMLATPDAQQGDAVLNAGGRYPEWRQEVAARSALGVALFNAGRYAPRVRCPVLMVVCEGDRTADPRAARRAAARIPDVRVVTVPGGHYAPFQDAHEQTVKAELAFLRQHVADTTAAALG